MFFSGSGCEGIKARSRAKADKETPKDLVASYNQMRLRMRALVHPMCDEVEHTADEIIGGTTNRSVQLAALRWKIEGVPALRTALFQPDPFTAAFDTWVLCNQMADYFEKGPGKEAFGAASIQAAATCRRMEEEFAQVVATATISGNVSKPRVAAHKWAAEHPIQHSIAGRESTLSRALERDILDEFSIGEVVGEVTMTTDDLNRKLDIYSDQLFRQARWEAELFKLETVKELSVDQAMPLAERGIKSAEQAARAIERLTPTIERAAAVAEKSPELVTSERKAAIEALHVELQEAIASVHDERLAALRQFHEALAEERKAITKDVESISLKAVERAMERLQWLVTLVLAIVLATAWAGLFVVRKMFFRRPLELRHQSP